jgi:YD repeat-containing protein
MRVALFSIFAACAACSGSRGAPAPAANGATSATTCTVREDHGGSAIAPFSMSFAFDGAGRLVSVTKAEGGANATRTRTFDASDRVIGDATTEMDASGKVTILRRATLERDRAGRRVRARYEEKRADGPAIVESVEHTYDDRGRLMRSVSKNEKGETTQVVERAYVADGLSVASGLPDRAEGMTTRMHVRFEGPPQRVVERVLELHEPTGSTTVERFVYDAQGRLARIDGKTTIEHPPRTELGAVTFAYDEAGRSVGSEKTYPDEPGSGVVETVKRTYAGACGEPVRRYFDPRSIYTADYDDDDD